MTTLHYFIFALCGNRRVSYRGARRGTRRLFCSNVVVEDLMEKKKI